MAYPKFTKGKAPFAFFSRWMIVGLAFCSLAFWFGIRTSFSVFYVALSASFPWRAGPLAGAQATALIAAMLSAPLTGVLIDRYGPRKIIIPGILITSAGLALCATMSSLFEFYVYYGVVTGSAVTSMGVAAYSVVLRGWFLKKRGLASGIAVSGMGAGMLVFLPLVQHCIASWGWREAFLLLGALCFGILFPATVCILRQRSYDDDAGPMMEKMGLDSQERPVTADLAVKTALVDPSYFQTMAQGTFWHFVLFSFFASAGVYIVLVHGVAFLVETGIESMVAAVLFALVGAISSVSRILWGWLSDRIGRELTYSIGCASALLGIGCLLLRRYLEIDAFAQWFTLFFGIGWGVTAPSVMASSADIFDGRQYGLLFGLVQAVINLAGAIGAWIGGLLFWRYQSYDGAFLVSVVALALSCLFIWMAAPRKKVRAGMTASTGYGDPRSNVR